MSDIISLGLWIKRRRKALDLTQDELAQRVGCSLATIRKVEADTRRPSREIATRLAEKLELAVEERAAFIQAARAELGVDRLAAPAQTVARGAFVPAQALSNAAPAREQRRYTRPSNLPIPPTPLVGRAREIEQICALLRRADIRLLTLTGPGGVGKTRLGLQLAAELIDDFADGVYFVDLAPVRVSTLVASAIAQTLGVREIGGQPLLERLKGELRDKHMLLLLDNFEQVVAAAPLLAELLAAVAKLKVIVTSRENLHLRGEQEIAVTPLALPAPGQLPAVEWLAQYAAIALFIQHARAIQPTFQLTNANAPAVAEICARLEGLPLAIELAAARLKLFAPEVLLARLNSQLALLSDGPRDLPARQQTMRTTIAWSYDLLNKAERRLFQRLGVFIGGCTLEAAEAVCGIAASTPQIADDQSAILERLAALVGKSLLKQVEGVDGEPRFSLLETIRQYALEKLAASGEADALRHRHAAYFRDTAQSYTTRAESARGKNWPERDNLRAALAWSQSAAGDPALALDLVLPVVRIEFTCGDREGARRQLKQALEYAEGLVDTHRYAEASATLGYLIGSTGDLPACRSLAEQAYTLYQKLGDKPGQASALELLGWVAREQGDAATARDWLEQAVALNRELGNTSQLNYALVHLAEVAVLEENAASAEMLLAESMALSRESYEQGSFSWSLNVLGHAAQLRGDYERAAQLHQEGLALFIDHLGEKHFGVAEAWESLGEIALGQGDLVAAPGWLAAALRLCAELGDRSRVAWCLAGLGSAAALDEEPKRAARLWGAAERLRATLGCRPAPAARATYERAVALAYAQLGEQAFTAAWAAGQALTLEQAMAEALAPIQRQPLAG